jgi:hypothetical protein
MMSFNCKECNESFDSLKSLHHHFKKHDMMLGDYYVKHYPRFNKLTNVPIQFKTYEDYMERDFATYDQLVEWCDTANQEEVGAYILSLLKKRIEKKGLDYGPCSTELFTSDLPPIRVYKRIFGSYKKVCDECGVKPMFGSNLPQEFHNDYRDVKILIDTREQQPLKFRYSAPLKLDVGDYAVTSENFKYTYADRKSFSDFCSTLSAEYKRFVRELQRCRQSECFLFIVIESDLYKMREINKYAPKRSNLDYIFHNMKELQRDFRDCCQFVFAKNRSSSQILIPKLLMLGPKIWNVDVQYFLDAGEMNYFEIK